MNVGDLFRSEPEHWQLRGDQMLWGEFAKVLAATPLPEDIRELERLLENAFWEATGHSLSFCNQVLVERYAEAGKTRGGISGADWRYRLFPLIISRGEALRAKAGE